MIILSSFLRFLSFIGRDYFQFRERNLKTSRLGHYLKSSECQHNSAQGRVAVFCSSAGEYEQAAPILRRLHNQGFDIIVFFFSASGLRFADKRQVIWPYFLAPIDHPHNWRKIYRYLEPDITLVIRHELWPGFLSVASSGKRQLYLVNASVAPQDKTSLIRKCIKQILFRFFHKIYVVSKSDRDFFHTHLKVPDTAIAITGDTKYDQVLERQKNCTDSVHKLLEKLKKIRRSFPCPKRRLIIGSAWPADYRIALQALQNILRADPETFIKTELIIALHQPNEENLTELEHAVKLSGFTSCRFSRETPSSDTSFETQAPPVILIDSIGLLTELYGCGHMALVGGGMDHKVHNVLEPACYGLALAFGPFYKNSGEALSLVSHNLATIVHNPDELSQWWMKVLSSPESYYGRESDIRNYMLKCAGASEQIMINLSQEHVRYAG